MRWKRGDVILAVFQGKLGKPRPAVILHANEYIQAHVTLLVCPFTTYLADSPNYRPTIVPSSENGLEETSQVMTDKTTHLDKTAMRGVIGTLSGSDMSQVEAALINITGLRQAIVPQPD